MTVVVETSCGQQRQRVEFLYDKLSCTFIIFSFYKFLIVMVGIGANDFRLVSFLKATMASLLKFFLTALICVEDMAVFC